MLELLLLWKLSDVREELRDIDTEDAIGFVAVSVIAQFVAWPITLGYFLSKNFGWGLGIPIAVATATLTLIFNWGFYFVVGFAAALVLAGFFCWVLTFAEE